MSIKKYLDVISKAAVKKGKKSIGKTKDTKLHVLRKNENNPKANAEPKANAPAKVRNPSEVQTPTKIDAANKPQTSKKAEPPKEIYAEAINSEKFSDMTSKTLSYQAFEVPDQPPVPTLANSLSKVLFNGGGVYFLKDPRTNVYNFDPRLENIMSISDFDFTKVPPYIPAGRDSKLAKLASDNGFEYTGSTSSMTSTLMQLHHAISHKRPPQILNLSKYFRGKVTTFTAPQLGPATLWLVDTSTNSEKKVYSIAQPHNDGPEIILTLLGNAMEIMLTTGCTEFEGYRKPPKGTDSKATDSKDSANLASTYNYTSSGKFLMRSQLDCYDPRLPGTGMFDLKTRACCAVRRDIDFAQIHDGLNYQIIKLHGEFESFEREYFELVRTALFKYSLQARIGRMDGIFVAYHNIRKLFGFQYLPLSEIDKVFHTAQLLTPEKRNGIPLPNTAGGEISESELKLYDLQTRLDVASYIADTEFKLSIKLLSDILDRMRNTVLQDARDLHEGDLSKAPKDINLAVHCTGPGRLVVVAKAGTFETDAGILQGPENECPVGVRAFSIELKQYVGGREVSTDTYPSPSDSSEEWNISASVYEHTQEKTALILRQLKLSKISQVITSEPQLDSPPTREFIENMLKKLPEASRNQQILRAFSQRGNTYTEWDEKRPKLVSF